MITTIDDWMHASNEDREETHNNWDVNNDEGKEIAHHVASIFTEECVYDVNETRANKQDGKWVIETFSDGNNYDTLKVRKNINFLGFDIVFNHIDKL